MQNGVWSVKVLTLQFALVLHSARNMHTPANQAILMMISMKDGMYGGCMSVVVSVTRCCYLMCAMCNWHRVIRKMTKHWYPLIASNDELNHALHIYTYLLEAKSEKTIIYLSNVCNISCIAILFTSLDEWRQEAWHDDGFAPDEGVADQDHSNILAYVSVSINHFTPRTQSATANWPSKRQGRLCTRFYRASLGHRYPGKLSPCWPHSVPVD